MGTRAKAGSVAGWLLLVAAPLLAQDGPVPGSVAGTVRAAGSGVLLSGVEIRVGGRVVLSDSVGRFRVPSLAPGAYVLEAEQYGYRAQAIADVMVRPARLTVVDVELEGVAFALDAVVARPSYFPEPELEPAGRFGYGGEEVRRAPGSAGDVSRVLMSLPSVAKVNDQSNGLIVRGGSPIENAFLVDGLEIPNINHFPTQGASSGPIGILNVDLIRDVALHAGGFPARFGHRLSSVMEVELREGNREEADLQLDLSMAGFGGVAEGPLGVLDGSWVASVRRSYLDLVVGLFDVGSTVAPRYGDYQGKVTARPAKGQEVSAVAVWADDHSGASWDQARENAMLYFGGQDVLQGTTGVVWNALWSDRVRSRTTLSQNLVDYDEAFRDLATNQPLLRNGSSERWLRLGHETQLRIPGGGAVRLGGDAAVLRADYDNRYGAHTGPLGDEVPELVVAEALSGTRLGGFATVSTPTLLGLTATVGLRVDGFTASAEAAAVSPRASVAWRVAPETVLSASAGVYRQELPAVLLAQSPGNRALAEPRAVHYVVGISHLLAPDTRFVVEAYRKSYDRLPMDPAQPALFPLDEVFYDYGFLSAHPDLVDSGEARSEGIEAVLRKKLSRDVYGLASGSLVRARYRGLDGKWRDRAVDNRYMVSLEGGWRASDRWELSLRWIFAGGPPYTPIDVAASADAGRAVLDASRVNDERYPDYHSLNLRVDHRFVFRRSSLVAYLSAWNVYDRENVAAYYWNADRQEVAPIPQWGLLPIFGLEYEF